MCLLDDLKGKERKDTKEKKGRVLVFDLGSHESVPPATRERKERQLQERKELTPYKPSHLKKVLPVQVVARFFLSGNVCYNRGVSRRVAQFETTRTLRGIVRLI